jgi:hypothetical protein
MEETRYQRIGREQRERQALRDQVAKKALKRKRKVRSPLAEARYHTDRIADRIDGYDRDDLGLSPDF